MGNTDQLLKSIEPEKQQLLQHPIYKKLTTLEMLQKFTTHHVFAVWDFMSLLKALQIKLTCVTTPWVPVGDKNTRYLINEIVLGEESDEDEQGNRASHYEMYLDAMKSLGASTEWIERFVNEIIKGKPVDEVINDTDLPATIKEFLTYTFDVVNNAPAHVVASVFTFGREDLIPDMFLQFVKELSEEHRYKVSDMKYYMERHIELDGDHHGNLAIQMLENLCGDDEAKWKEATEAAITSLKKRSVLWDGVLQ